MPASYLEFTADEGRCNDPLYPVFDVKFWRRDGHDDRLAVRWAPRPSADGTVLGGIGPAQVRDVVAVAFYPVDLPSQQCSFPVPVYVMSVWRWNARENENMLVAHQFLYAEGYNARADNDPDQLSNVDKENSKVQKCLRLPRDKIDKSFDQYLWEQFFGFNVARHARGYVVASMLRIPAPAPHDHLQALLRDMQIKETDGHILAEWKCAICLGGLEEGRDLVSAHDALERRGGGQLLHVFHKRCLDRWKVLKAECPFRCEPSLCPRLLETVWKNGTTTLSARMGANPYEKAK